MIMCDTRASGITADLNDSYFVRIEPRPNGGALVVWTDLPDQAMVFDDVSAAAEFCQDSPLEMFVVSFVPAAGLLPPAESHADFLGRLSQIRADAEARHAAKQDHPRPEPVSLADELRAMGLM